MTSGIGKTILIWKNMKKDSMITVTKKYMYFWEKAGAQTGRFYNHLQFLNRKMIGMRYKNISLLGDKIELCIDPDPVSQDIAYMLLGVGLGENNSSMGAGYVNYKTYQ